MTFYQKIANILERYISRKSIFKYGFNYSPMYSRSTGWITSVSSDLYCVDIKIPLTWRNRNIMGSMFGGSMLSATDPISMTQLFFILGNNYVVWDKATSIRFRNPARSTVYASFQFLEDEIEKILQEVNQKGSVDVIKQIELRDKSDKLIAEITKTIFVATRSAYREKLKKRNI